MKVAINYADNNFKESQKYNTKTAYKRGKFDKVIEYGPSDIDEEFYKTHKKILTQNRGGGYWLWKPYIIKKTLDSLEYGDYLFYCDSGAYYCNSIDYLIECLEKNNEEILVFEIPLIEKQWTKKECFIKMECNSHKYTDTNQRIATYILFKKTKRTIKFVEDYLKYCTDESLLTDDEFIVENNYSNFIDHRHDQSIFSLLSKKYCIKSYREPSQYGDRPWEYFANNRLYDEKKYDNSQYPRIVISYRKANRIRFSIKEKLKDILQLINLRYIK